MDYHPSLSGGGQSIEATLKTKFSKDRRNTFVVDRRVRIEPVRPRIHVQRQHLRQVGSLEQQLPSGNQLPKLIEFDFIQPKQVGVLLAIQGRVRQQQLRRASLNDGAQQVRRREVVHCLRRENHRRVPLSPRFQRLLDVRSQPVVLNETPGFIHHAELQSADLSPVVYAGGHSVKNIKK